MSNRPILPLLLIACFAFAAPSLAERKCCGCSAPDGSCTASACCRDGCMAICLKGHCEASCHDSSTGAEEATAESAEAEGGARVSFVSKQATAQQLAIFLSRATKRQVAFAPFASDEPFAVEIQNVPADRLVRALAKFGVVTVGGERVAGARQPALGGDQRFSLEAKNVPVQRLAELLSGLLGREVAIEAAEADETISLQVQDAPAEQLLRLLAKAAEVRVDGERIVPY